MDATKDPAPAIGEFRLAIEDQRTYLIGYEQPSEALAYETLRTLDDLFCRDLMEPKRQLEKTERQFRRISTWGINHALRRIVPRVPRDTFFQDFPSHGTIQKQADDFVFNCGILELAERSELWLRDGILTAELRVHPDLEGPGTRKVLILRSGVDSYFDEEIGIAGLHWASDRVRGVDRAWERSLEKRHRTLQRDLERHVILVDSWRALYTSTQEIDRYFVEWARLYLRRIHSQDILAPEDMIGGRPFSQYVDVLTALSGRSQKHLAFAAILRARDRAVHIRNLLTTHVHRDSFIESLARELDGTRIDIENILASFVLTGENLDTHTRSGQAAWAPLVQASAHTFIFPVYGLDINPFLFLFTDLRHRHEGNWFRVANGREGRWIAEIETLFNDARWQTHGRNLRLRTDGKVITDIDFAAFQREANELALFQLKWQHPIGMDNRGRRSAGKNLIEESNRWVERVISWLSQHGADELTRRLGFESSASPSVHLFVLGRYHVYLSGFETHDSRAVWSDWAHFQRALVEDQGPTTVSKVAARLRLVVERSRGRKTGESMALPVGDLTVILNPSSIPVAPDAEA
jgi:hypothetical protein